MKQALLFFGALLCLLLTSQAASNSPTYETTCLDNCTCYRNVYHILIDCTSHYNQVVQPVAAEVVSSLLARGNAAVHICFYPYGGCSGYLTSMTDAYDAIMSSSDFGGSFHVEDGIRMTLQSISELNSQRPNSYQLKDAPVLQDKYLILGKTDGGAPGPLLNQIKQAGFEVFYLGAYDHQYPSFPASAHRVYAAWSSYESMQDPTAQFLARVRGDKNNMCAFYGYGSPRVLTLDGNVYNAPGVGEFLLLSTMGADALLRVQIRQTPRESAKDGSTELRAVSIGMNEEKVLFFYDPEQDIITISINNDPIDLDYNGEARFFFWQDMQWRVSKREPYGGFSITSSSKGTHFKIEFSKFGSGVIIKPASNAFGASEGLCGSYDACPTNDFVLPDGSVASLKTISDKKKGADARLDFVNSWRVSPALSLFNLVGAEKYLPPSDWKPINPSSGLSRAEEFCEGVPPSLFDGCLSDTSAVGHLYASFLSFELVRFACKIYCQDPTLAYTWLDPSTSCRGYCPNFSTNLHQGYNTTQLPDILLRGSNGPKAFFKPAINLGGVYTFNLRANDLCDDQARNITVTIKCDPAPTISTLTTYLNEENQANKKATNLTIQRTAWGLPTVHLFATVQTAGNPANLRYMWAATNVTAPPRDSNPPDWDYLLEQVNEQLQDSETSRPIFTPMWPGIYTLEVAVSDGCQVVKEEMVIEFKCGSCASAPRIDAGVRESLWTKPMSDSGYFPWISLHAQSSLKADHSLEPSYLWKVTGKKGITNMKVEEQTSTRFLLYKEVTPPSLISRTFTSTHNEGDKDYSYPSGLSSIQHPTIINWRVKELWFEDAIITWTTTTVNVTTEVTRNRVIEEACIVNLDDSSSLNNGLSFEETSSGDPFKARATCPGSYTVALFAMDDCYNQTIPTNETIEVQASCGSHPRAIASCPHRVVFDYNSRAFPPASLKSEGSYDPSHTAPTDPDINGHNLDYLWELVSKPPNSEVELNSESPTGSIYPDMVGTYTMKLTASNGCNMDSMITTLQAVCTEPAPLLTIGAATTTLTFTGTGPSVFDLFASLVYPNFPDNLETTWELITPPTIDPNILATKHDTYTPVFVNHQGHNVSLSVATQGNYVVRATVRDFCQQPVSKDITLTHNCPALVTAVTPAGPFNVIFDYDTRTFSPLTLNASASTVPIPNHSAWYLVGVPADYEGTLPSSIDQGLITSYRPFLPGSYRVRFVHSDYCRFQFKDVTFTAVCPQTPVARITTTTTTIPTNATFKLSSSTSSGDLNGYTWTLIQKPDGETVSYDLSTDPELEFPPGYGPGSYLFQLEVRDGCKTSKATLRLTATCVPLPFSPVATATASVMWAGNRFQLVELDGHSSSFGSLSPDDLDFRWEVLEAPAGSFYAPFSTTNATTTVDSPPPNVDPVNQTTTVTTTTATQQTSYLQHIRRVFIREADNPSRSQLAFFIPDVPGNYRVALTLSSGSLDDLCLAKTSAPVTISAKCNLPPSISSQDPPEVPLAPNVHTRIFLDASATTDPENDPLTFLWEPLITPDTAPSEAIAQVEPLSNPTSATASFIATRGGVYPFRLTVSDGCNVVTTTVTVTTSCPYADELSASRKKQREAEKDMIVAKFSDIQLSQEAFVLVDSLLASSCASEYTWELVDYDQSMLGKTEAFKGSAGFKAAIAVPVLIGGALIVALLAFVGFKFFMAGGKGFGKGSPPADPVTGNPAPQDAEW